MAQSDERSWDRCLRRGSQVATIFAAAAAVAGACIAWQQLPRIGDIGDRLVQDCDPGMDVHAGEFCQILVGEREERFHVYEGGAYPPGQPEAQESTAKVDWDAFGVTFQAVRVDDGDGAWKIEVAGPWERVGRGERHLCRIGDELRPGQLCVEGKTGAQFRVYATDQHYAGDAREFFAEGYAVLFYEPEKIAAGENKDRLNDKKVTYGSFSAEKIEGTKSWRITGVADGTEDAE